MAASACAIAGSLACAAVLHGAAARPEAVWMVPVACAWGIAVMALHGPAPSMRVVLAVAAISRMALVGVPPWLSDDLFRYLWEGQALLAGHAPLYEAPASLPALDPELLARVNHPELPSVYPPLGMTWFALLSVLGGTVQVAQAATAVADLVTVWALGRVRPDSAWLYALLPLPALEAAAGAHVDVPAVAVAALAVTAAAAHRHRTGFVLLVAGGLLKVFPVVALPTAWRALTGRDRWLMPVLALAAGTLLMVPLLQPQLPPGLVAYSTRWSFNGLAFTPLAPWLGVATRPVLVAIGVAVSAATVTRATTVAGAWASIGLAFVALSPTMHPWYALWALVPSLFLGDRRVAAACVFLPLAYLVLGTYDPATETWSEAPWLWAATWGPALGAAGLMAWRDRGRVR